MIKAPSRVTLLRGAFESIEGSRYSGLLSEVLKKYGSNQPWRILTRLFGYLPLAALIDDSYLALSRITDCELYSKNIECLRQVNRLKKIEQP